MKKYTIVLIIACLIIAASGCQGKTVEKPIDSNGNGNGAQAVNLPGSAEDTSKDASDGVSGREADDASEDVIEITENLFVAQINDVYLNPDDYLRETFRYEGIFTVFEVPERGRTYYSVIRYGPGCCGFDADVGFEVIWDKPYPKQNDWVEATGVLVTYEEDGNKHLRLLLSSLKTLPYRGEETVYN